jgi:hypothetical protein
MFAKLKRKADDWFDDTFIGRNFMFIFFLFDQLFVLIAGISIGYNL